MKETAGQTMRKDVQTDPELSAQTKSATVIPTATTEGTKGTAPHANVRLVNSNATSEDAFRSINSAMENQTALTFQTNRIVKDNAPAMNSDATQDNVYR
ncbi:unnamed protein product [Callosobruchus maculatus]|uniref:Uncharacterized protein n=1 Tax=Callosobruchus maculatus TaxID=64391 RepID=A0A653BMU2_CALMS|nr:unnamed protein product [Callosobruchus maculatus]